MPLPDDALAGFIILTNAKLGSLITSTAVCEERLPRMGKEEWGKIQTNPRLREALGSGEGSVRGSFS